MNAQLILKYWVILSPVQDFASVFDELLKVLLVPILLNVTLERAGSPIGPVSNLPTLCTYHMASEMLVDTYV